MDINEQFLFDKSPIKAYEIPFFTKEWLEKNITTKLLREYFLKDMDFNEDTVKSDLIRYNLQDIFHCSDEEIYDEIEVSGLEIEFLLPVFKRFIPIERTKGGFVISGGIDIKTCYYVDDIKMMDEENLAAEYIGPHSETIEKTIYIDVTLSGEILSIYS